MTEEFDEINQPVFWDNSKNDELARQAQAARRQWHEVKTETKGERGMSELKRWVNFQSDGKEVRYNTMPNGTYIHEDILTKRDATIAQLRQELVEKYERLFEIYTALAQAGFPVMEPEKAAERIAALEASLTAERKRADALAAALEWIKTKTEVHRLHGGKHTDYVHALRLIEDKADAALAAHHAPKAG